MTEESEKCGTVQQPKDLRQCVCVFTYAGLSSSISAVVERGSKSRFFLTLCLGDVGLPGPALPLFVSYSCRQKWSFNYSGVTGRGAGFLEVAFIPAIFSFTLLPAMRGLQRLCAHKVKNGERGNWWISRFVFHVKAGAGHLKPRGSQLTSKLMRSHTDTHTHCEGSSRER